ncbi:MAG: hypothetical protein QT04_C0036G0005 [archaeon GW2011_AR11]|nr:MAG: hypothetical protein QT04_C0036G0005 [archaeon GW2011_AR11]
MQADGEMVERAGDVERGKEVHDALDLGKPFFLDACRGVLLERIGGIDGLRKAAADVRILQQTLELHADGVLLPRHEGGCAGGDVPPVCRQLSGQRGEQGAALHAVDEDVEAVCGIELDEHLLQRRPGGDVVKADGDVSLPDEAAERRECGRLLLPDACQVRLGREAVGGLVLCDAGDDALR